MKIIGYSALAALVSSLALAEDAPAPIEDDLQAYLEIGRESRVLLDEGEARVDVSGLAALGGSDFGIGSRSSTEFEGSVQVSYGIAKDLEVFAAIPFGSFSAEAELLGTSISHTGSGLGSVRLGSRYMLVHETGKLPEINASLQLGLPTQTYGNSETSVSSEVSVLSTLDPFLLNGTIGYTRALNDNADRLNISAGMVFGVSDRVALGTNIVWSSGLEEIGDPLQDQLSLTGSMAVVFGKNVIEPSIGIGLTEATPDVVLGIGWSRRF